MGFLFFRSEALVEDERGKKWKKVEKEKKTRRREKNSHSHTFSFFFD